MKRESFDRSEDHWLVKRTLMIRGKVEPEVLFVPITEAALVFFFGSSAHVFEPVNAVMPLVMIAPLVDVPIRFRIAEDGGYFAAQCRASVLSRALQLDLTPQPRIGIPFVNPQTEALCSTLPDMNPEEQRAEVFRFIESLHPECYVPDAVDRVYDQIVEGAQPLPDLVGSCGMSERTLQRKFLSRTGISLKTLVRIARVGRFWAESVENNGMDFKNSQEAEAYFDQSHLIRDFKSVTGATPNRFFSACTDTTKELADKNATSADS